MNQIIWPWRVIDVITEKAQILVRLILSVWCEVGFSIHAWMTGLLTLRFPQQGMWTG